MSLSCDDQLSTMIPSVDSTELVVLVEYSPDFLQWVCSIINPCCIITAFPFSLWSPKLFVNLEWGREIKSGMVDNVPIIYIADIGISCVELELSKYLFNCIYLFIKLGNHKIDFSTLFSGGCLGIFYGAKQICCENFTHNPELIEQKFSYGRRDLFVSQALSDLFGQ